jgi:hypothetical protein
VAQTTIGLRQHAGQLRREDDGRRPARRSGHLGPKEEVPGIGVDELVVALDVEPVGGQHARDAMNEPHLVGAVDQHDFPGRHACGHHQPHVP